MGPRRVRVRRQGGDLFWPVMLVLLAAVAGLFFFWSQNGQRQASRPIRHRQVATRQDSRPTVYQPTAAPEREPAPEDQPQYPDYPRGNGEPAPVGGPPPAAPRMPGNSYGTRTPPPAAPSTAHPRQTATPARTQAPVIAGSPGGRGTGLRHPDSPAGYNDPLPQASPVTGYERSINDAGAPKGY